MILKKELQLAYALAGILLVVGILSYVASSPEPPASSEWPTDFRNPSPKVPETQKTSLFLRIMYQSVAGNVLFDHKAHFSPEKYGVSCQDCHPSFRMTYEEYLLQGMEEPGVSDTSVDSFSSASTGEVEVFTNKDEAHELCIGCHEEYEAGPVNCLGCHVL